MTPTTTNHRLSIDEISELQQALTDTTLECYHFKAMVHPNGDSEILQAWANSLVVVYDVRSLDRETIAKLNDEIENSALLRWWCNRINMAIRSTSIDPVRIEDYIVNALDFHTGADTLLNFKNADLARHEWPELLRMFPIVRVVALWNILRIPFQSLLLTTDERDDESNGAKGHTE